MYGFGRVNMMVSFSRRLTSFVVTPSGASITAGLALLVASQAPEQTAVRLTIGGLGATLLLLGIARRALRVEDQDRAIHTTRASVDRIADDVVTTGRAVEQTTRTVEQLPSRIRSEMDRREEQVVGRLRNAEVRITESVRESGRRADELDRRVARNESERKEREAAAAARGHDAHRYVTINDVRLAVLSGNSDAQWYSQRGVHEERHSRLYTMIHEAGFQTFLDVGANYGFVSILARRAAPEIQIIAVEADERLIPLIKSNFDWNGIAGAQIIHAIAGAEIDPSTTFSLNPAGTLDNRVNMDGWENSSVAQTTIDQMLANSHDGPVFLKIDTQGFEAQVLAGATSSLLGRDDWMMKMEFGPVWLRSQAVNPIAFLGDLCERFEVSEFPARIPFFAQTLDELFDCPIERSATASFVDYVETLNRDGRGWVDLLIRPRSHGHG